MVGGDGARRGTREMLLERYRVELDRSTEANGHWGHLLIGLLMRVRQAPADDEIEARACAAPEALLIPHHRPAAHIEIRSAM